MPKKRPSPKRPPSLTPEFRAFGRRLALARHVSGLGSGELDQAARVARGRTSRAEKGQRLQRISADTVIRLANALNVRPGWLLTGEEPMRTVATPVPESGERTA